MQFNVSQLLKEVVGSKRSYEINCSPDEGETGHPIVGKVEFIRTNRSILVRGSLKTETEAICSRCLTPCICPVTIELEEEYFPVINVYSGTRVVVPDDAEGFTIDQRHILDLSEAIRQYTLLNTPMRPLCKPDCSGLCPQCGKNLNHGKCQCNSTL